MKRLLLAAVAALVFAAPAQAADYVVTGIGDGTGTCTDGTCTSLRAALAATNVQPDGDTIALPAGTIGLSNGALTITNPVTLTGAGANLTTIRADAAGGRVLEITGATAALNNLTLQGGTAPQGGALLAQTSTVTLTRVRVTGGTAESGGGIANRSGTMVINESLIDTNQATQGAGTGGGIVNLGDTVGGSSSLTISHSTIAANTAKVGGGLVSDGNPQNALATTGVTIGQNRSTEGAGGVHIGAGTWTSQLTLVSDNLREQTPTNCTGADATSSGWNLENFDECGFTQDSDKRNVLNARLATSLVDNGGPTFTLALLPGSQALNIRTTGCTGTDQRGTARPQGAGCDAGAFESAGAPSGPPVITTPAPNLYTGASEQTFSGTADPGAAIEIYLTGLVATTEANAQGEWATRFALPTAEGAYTYGVSANGSARSTMTLTVDRTRPAPAVATPTTTTDAATLTFGAAAEPTASFACRLEGPGRSAEFAPCTSPARYDGLAAGAYRFTVRATDAAGNSADSTPQDFSIAGAPPVVVPEPSVAPTPTPTPTPRPTETPAPQPDVGESVVIRPTGGRVFIQLPGSSQFVELRSIGEIPLGATIDTRNGRVQLRFETEDGKVQTATFYGGLFLVRQVGKILDLKLTEPLAACPKKGKAAAAQTKKAKKRKLWGDGKGSFRTTGKYSAATVRGTKWLVEDSCAGTLTRVTTGVVAVRAGQRTVLVRAGKRYLAKPR